jgi:hypothetical protein
MASEVSAQPLTPEIRSLLRGLRWRIRAYVWAEGLITALVWVGLTFWIALALDYFPVLVWASELPREVRAVGLLAIAGVLAWICYRLILARTFVRLADRSMAILLERRYPKFGDSLVTTVELARGRNLAEYSDEMLATTRRLALQGLPEVQLREVFRITPLALKLLAAVVCIVPIIVFAAVQGSAFELGIRRLYLLENTPWPRNAAIEMVGIEVERVSPRTGEAVFSETRTFEDGEAKVARGSTLAVRVRADTKAKTVPDVCRIVYRTSEGTRGQVNMRKDGSPRADGYQYFSYIGKPFQGILDDLTFDVVGYDHRLNDHKLRVVEAPAVVETELECTFPSYLVDESSKQWLPRTLEYRSSGTQLPEGTRVVIRMKSNKPLEGVEFSLPGDNTVETRELNAASGEQPLAVEYVVDSLDGSFTLDVVLRDTDEVYSDSPHRLFLSATTDEAPKVDVAMRGIGSAVTPDVLIPAQGQITDDHAVAESWFAFQVNDKNEQKQAIGRTRDGKVAASLDFRELRSRCAPPIAITSTVPSRMWGKASGWRSWRL